MISKSRAAANDLTLLILLSLNTCAFADGPFDPTFGDTGFGFEVVKIGDTTSIVDSAQISAITVDSNNHLITAGTSEGKLFVARHRNSPAGSLDENFGVEGVVTSVFGDMNSSATSVHVDHHGRIVVGGRVNGIISCPDGDTNQTFFTAVRLINDTSNGGDADFTFGSFGVALFGGCDQDLSGASDIAIDHDDGVIAVGSVVTSASGLSERTAAIALIRWTASGTLDTSFGEKGTRLTSYGDAAYGVSLKRDSSGQIWVAAVAEDSENRVPLILRYTPDGQLDTTFGNNGIVALPPIATVAGSVYGDICCIAIDSRGRAYIAGDMSQVTGGYLRFLARVTDAGFLDISFGLNGVAMTAPYSQSYAVGLALDSSDRPILAGYCSVYAYAESCVMHFNLDGTVNGTVGNEGIYTAQLGFGQTYATSLLVDDFGRSTISAIAYGPSGLPLPVLIRYDEMFGDGFD